MSYHYYTVRPDRALGWIVHGFDEHPAGSVLEGQPRKVFLDAFQSREEALRVYPHAQSGSAWTDPRVSLSHLPGPDDPVAGGAYPDDRDD